MCNYHDILKQYWGFNSFRPLQEDIVKSVAEGRDTLALMPTGGGKSLTFQVPALASEGICLVITPLIALMRDQVENLKARKIKAMALHSGMTREEIAVALDNCVYGDFKFLYVSPERLATEIFRVRVQKMNVNLIAVDEAHCISQWGYDFRPSYLKISGLRELLPGVPVLALTATATKEVAKDIMEKLAFGSEHMLQKSFRRENLVYVVRKTEDKFKELIKITGRINGSGIIYVRNRKKTRDITEFLLKNGIRADNYHAGLKHDLRTEKQDQWRSNTARIMVATNAFGMGIDKADVRFVIHFDLPDSPETYFQEAGRAGRDEQPAWAILLHSPSDLQQAEKRVEVNFPDFSTLRAIYIALFNYLQVPVGGGKGNTFDFILGEFLSQYSWSALTVTSALNILSREGYFEITDEINNPSRIHFIIRRDDLYKFQVKNPAFDNFIKVILRSYTGLFSQYVAFDEHTLAVRTGLSRDEVYKYLVKLSGMHVIKYIPKKQNPVITLLEERLDERNIYISTESYRFRKARFVDRLNVMKEYAGNENVCRSRFLLTYFGERNTKACGKCDVCIGNRKQKLSRNEYEKYEKEIIPLLTNQPGDVAMISDKLGIEAEKLSGILERMMDEGKIFRGEDMNFQLSDS
ncbi:MAG: RecQ family ATP-dependent DNA helicase [Bacteroidales bacterium]|nr:RecQ family ATP-dependent DNA helicase [Bacteroidales bacterium]